MTSALGLPTFLTLMALVCTTVVGDTERMISTSETVYVDLDFYTQLVCEMNIKPDKFEWKFYPSSEPYNAKTEINLSNATFRLMPTNSFNVHRRKSTLSITVKDTSLAGDYQCLAYYGAKVVASVPWRITIERLQPFPPQENASATVQVNNTVSWRCEAPESNPEAYIDYLKGEEYISSELLTTAESQNSSGPQIKSLILSNVGVDKSGTYRCVASNTFRKEPSNAIFQLEVVRNGPSSPPRFILPPVTEYTVLSGSSVFLECSAVGNPVPKVFWTKKQSELPSKRTDMVPGGIIIKNIESSDAGVYVCNHTNVYGTISHQITLRYHEEPKVDCLTNSTDVTLGENLDLECYVTGVPQPQIAWFLNGFSVINDSAVEVTGRNISFRPAGKRHAGNLQIFARNEVKTVYSSIKITVIPTTSVDPNLVTMAPHHQHRPISKKPTIKRRKQKQPKLVPPNKPNISRADDETAVVRWSVPPNDGLQIVFFKVQYKDLGPATRTNGHRGQGEWETANTDIPPNTEVTYVVQPLKPDHIYKFRVAAVYSNNDSRNSPISSRFHLKRMDFDNKHPLPVCQITDTETINSSSIKVYWECPPFNETVDGFYLSYMPADRAGDDYTKSTAEGKNTRSYVITHLAAQSRYDIKLQSYNSKFASDYSQIVQGKTELSTAQPFTTDTPEPPSTTSSPQTNQPTKLYIIIAGAVLGCSVVITAVVLLLFVCRKWQRQKLTGGTKDKAAEHHIQADSADYVVESKPLRQNGCTITNGNRITITSNPLDSDNKKPIASIEMRNLANNNVRPTLGHHSANRQTDGPVLGQHIKEDRMSEHHPSTAEERKNSKIKHARHNGGSLRRTTNIRV